MNPITLVTNALEYYDQNLETFNSLYKDIRYTKFIKNEGDLDHNQIIFFGEDKKELFRSSYETIGLYNLEASIWIWAWSVPYFSKNNTNIVRKIWNYGATLDPEMIYIKTELTTSRFQIADPIQLDIHISIASYLSKKPVIYKHFEFYPPEVDSDGYYDIKAKTKLFQIHYLFLLDKNNVEFTL